MGVSMDGLGVLLVAGLRRYGGTRKMKAHLVWGCGALLRCLSVRRCTTQRCLDRELLVIVQQCVCTSTVSARSSVGVGLSVNYSSSLVCAGAVFVLVACM